MCFMLKNDSMLILIIDSLPPCAGATSKHFLHILVATTEVCGVDLAATHGSGVCHGNSWSIRRRGAGADLGVQSSMNILHVNVGIKIILLLIMSQKYYRSIALFVKIYSNVQRS